MATVTKPMALDESIHTTDGNNTNLADVLKSGLAGVASAISPDASDIPYRDSNVETALDDLASTKADNATTLSGYGITDAYTQTETDNLLSAKQNTLTFDDTPTESSTNPVKSGGVYDAINTTKTTLNGNPLNFSTEISQNASECILDIEPVQDLHGYDHPWPAGGGKNLLPMVLDDIKAVNTSGTWADNVYTYNDVTFTVNMDDDGNITSISINGTASAESRLNFSSIYIDAGSYIINGTPSTGSSTTYRILVYNQSMPGYIAFDNGSGSSFTLSDTSRLSIFINITNGVTVSNIIFYPMVRLATETDATFEPYTNICAISGRDSVELVGCGKNLFDAGAITDNAWITANDTTISAEHPGYCVSDYIPMKSGVTMYIPYKGETTRCALYDINKNGVEYYAFGSGTFTPAYDGYIRITLGTASNTGNVDVDTYQIELGSTATTYEPYSADTKNYSLPTTVYGGTLDINSGVLTVTHGYTVLDGSENWMWLSSDPHAWFFLGGFTPKHYADIVSSHFNTIYSTADRGQSNSIWTLFSQLHVHPDSTIIPSGLNNDGLAEFKTWLGNNNVQVCYELATPTTYQLTPDQVSLLLGTNNLSTDADSIKVTFSNGTLATLSDIQASEVSILKRLEILEALVNQ